MRQFKKRTIALVLASVITVAGSFAAENYKNSLTGLGFTVAENGAINMVVKTRTPYSGNVLPIKKDANTFILMLPETDSDSVAQTPNLDSVSNYISSVNVRTMPYSPNGKGYTKVTIKTNNVQQIAAQNVVYIPVSAEPAMLPKTDHNSESNNNVQNESFSINEKSDNSNNYYQSENSSSEEPHDEIVQNEESHDVNAGEGQSLSQNSVPVQQTEYQPQKTKNNSYEKTLLGFGVLIIALVIIFFFFRAKNKLQEIAGEDLEISLDDEESAQKDKKQEKKQPPKNIRDTINRIDDSYAKTASISMTNYHNNIVREPQKEENLNIVDLDELFQETQGANGEDEENSALEDFLSGFSFLEDEQTLQEDEITYDKEAYDRFIKSEDLKFSKNDIQAIEKLLNLEITDDTKQNIEQYAVSNPIKKKVTKQEILENIVTTYKISQNINFTSEDIDIIRKLISIEIDPDFVTDLRTNPNLTKQMYASTHSDSQRQPKPSEILTLKVKDMLPNLEEALLKQDYDTQIKERKKDVIYYSEGYEFSTLKVKSLLPDISKELNNQEAYISKPSEEVPLADNTYVNEKLKVSVDLPDLQDVLAHPEKYKEPEKEPVVVDEDALLNSILNVQFKDFAEGNQFEVLNNFDDEPVPTVWDIQEEFKQFDNFSLADEDEQIVETDKEYPAANIDIGMHQTADLVINKPIEKVPDSTIKPLVQEQTVKNITESNKAGTTEFPQKPLKCIIGGIGYDVIDTVQLQDDKGCHLAKGDSKCVVLAYEGETYRIIKEYDKISSEKIQARINGKIADGSPRYLIKVGSNKFIVDIKDNHIKYVMDLC